MYAQPSHWPPSAEESPHGNSPLAGEYHERSPSLESTPMKYESQKMQELSSADIARWADLQCADPRCASPFLRPEFTQWMSEVREDIRVLVIRKGDVAVGFFPFGRCGAAAHPVGTPLSDSQGVVAAPSCRWDGLELLKATGLRRLVFDHWIPGQEEIGPFCSVGVPCAYVDLSEGFEAYVVNKKKQGSNLFHDVRRKQKKLVQDHGKIRCELLHDPQSVERLMEWQSAQCTRTRVADLLRFNWPRQILHATVARGTEACGTLMWGLYTNERLIAASMVFRSHQFGHGWFMAFDSNYARYSPGTILMDGVLRELPVLGVTRLDMGKGVSGYKKRLMTGSTITHEGIIDPRPAARAVWRHWQQTRDWLRRSRWRPLAHRANRVISNVRWFLGSNY